MLVPVPMLAQMQHQSKSAMGVVQRERERERGGGVLSLGCAPSASRWSRFPDPVLRSVVFLFSFVREGVFHQLVHP